MKRLKVYKNRTISTLLVVCIMITILLSNVAGFSAASTYLRYDFSGINKDDAGYAEGTISLEVEENGQYSLYWADDTAALEGYFALDTVDATAGTPATVDMGYHTAIPSKATKLIAVSAQAEPTVSNAVAVFEIPKSKQLLTESGNLLYTFNSYSDVHIDINGFYVNAEKYWKSALQFASEKDTDFIVSSGDMITNSTEADAEWFIYEKLIADSDYTKPVWESDGNHDLRTGVVSGLTSFVRASGTDNTEENFERNTPFYYVKEENTGDIFIFMALENDHNPSSCDEFSDEQLSWLTELLDKYYGTGVNIYIIEHSPIDGFGAGDRMDNPYYKAHLSEKYMSTVLFKNLLIKYPKLIWMSGHTHEDFSMGYNYSNENGTACHMVHNPAVAGTTWAAPSDYSLDYKSGAGYNSQGYYVEVYDNQVVYYGANLTDKKIYPKYCYIMDGARNTTPDAVNPTQVPETIAPDLETEAPASVLPEGIETKRVYFANTVKWQFVDCYSWSTYDVSTCVWPGYKAEYYGTTEQGVDLYYCDIPATHDKLIWNNAGNNRQTADIELDGVNDYFIPTSSGTKISVEATVWDYDVPAPSESVTEPAATTSPETAENIIEEPAANDEPAKIPHTELSKRASESSLEHRSPSKFVLGDVNDDEEIDVLDVTVIQRFSAFISGLTDSKLISGDVNFDENVDIIDATLIQRFISNLIDEFGTEADRVFANAKFTLNDLYTFSSYDQYQKLKDIFVQYKNREEGTDLSALTKLQEKLVAFADAISVPVVPPIYDIGDTYYFENTGDWNEVYCYAWTGSSQYASWPGLPMQKVGTNNGHDVYGVKFEKPAQYRYIIFNSGNTGTVQTVDLKLSYYEYNCFSPDGTLTDSKLNVKNFNYKSDIEPTVIKPAVTDENRYALCYYISGVHGWGDMDTYFKPQPDGTYALEYTATGADNISFNVYSTENKTYNCNSVSASYSCSEPAETLYELVASASRGKSITVKSVTAGTKLYFVYNPVDNTVTVSAVPAPTEPATEPEPTVVEPTSSTEPIPTPSEEVTEVPTEPTKVNLYFVPAKEYDTDGYIFKVNVKDTAGKYHKYTFEKTDESIGGVSLYKVTLTNPSYTDITKLQYQTLDSASAFIGQVAVEKTATLISCNDTVMICSSAKKGTISNYEKKT